MVPVLDPEIVDSTPVVAERLSQAFLMSLVMSSAAVVGKSSSMERKASDSGGRMSRQQSRREAAVIVPVIEDVSEHGGKAHVEQAGKMTPTSPTGAHLLLFPHDTPIDYERRSHSLQKL